jgi:hypothetical protein
MFDSLYDKLYLATILLTIITGVYGIIKLKGVHISTTDHHLTDEQSDGLVMGVFHILLSVVCVCFLL